MCEQQRSFTPGFRRKELHATESAVEVRRARRRLEDIVTDERVGLFTPDKDGYTHTTSRGRVAVIAARRGTVCGEVGRVLRFPSTQHPHPLCQSAVALVHRCSSRRRMELEIEWLAWRLGIGDARRRRRPDSLGLALNVPPRVCSLAFVPRPCSSFI